MSKPETPRPRAAAAPAGTVLDQDPRAATENSASSSPSSHAAPAGFEQALAELETIVTRMESGELTLEQSLAAYKRGAVLLQYCQLALRDAQQQVKVLESGVLRDFAGADDNGQ